jgi:hypothetical protein
MNNSKQTSIALIVTLLLFSNFFIGCQKSDTPSSAPPTEKTTSKNSGVFDFEKNIGWLHGTCLAIKNGSLQPGTKITLVKFTEPQSILETVLQGQATAESGCFALFEDRVAMNQKKQRSFYSVTLPESETNIMAIGIVGQDIAISIEDKNAKADLNADGVPEVFSSCQTSEGMKFFVWSAESYQGSPLWSDYYYLGYDMQPNCPEGY